MRCRSWVIALFSFSSLRSWLQRGTRPWVRRETVSRTSRAGPGAGRNSVLMTSSRLTRGIAPKRGGALVRNIARSARRQTIGGSSRISRASTRSAATTSRRKASPIAMPIVRRRDVRGTTASPLRIHRRSGAFRHQPIRAAAGRECARNRRPPTTAVCCLRDSRFRPRRRDRLARRRNRVSGRTRVR
jgi:hypothetical protein